MPLGRALGVQAALIGVELDRNILAEAGDNTSELRWVLQSGGLSLSSIQPDKEFTEDVPVCLQLSTGLWVVVVASQGGFVTLCDPERAGEGRSVPLGLLQQAGIRSALLVRKSLDRIALDQDVTTRQGHWLWSRVLSGSNPIASILASSLIANLLAAVIALFSLQVYDRLRSSRCFRFRSMTGSSRTAPRTRFGCFWRVCRWRWFWRPCCVSRGPV